MVLVSFDRFGFTLARLRITIDPLLPLVVIFMAWVLSERYFPQIMYTQAVWIYWTMGVVSSVFLTFSIFFHEYGHALAANWLRLPLERIHLYLFGGMAELKRRPLRPIEELLIALCGPAASFLFAIVSWGAALLLQSVAYEAFLVMQFVFYMNLLLGGFNLLPIFPLDGGRALRALLWKIKKNYYRASILTYQMSLAIIFVLLAICGILLVREGLSVAFWVAFLALYLWYTAYSGRDELIYHPGFDDLIYRIDEDRSPVSIIRQLNRMDARYLPNAVIPVIREGELDSVIMGEELSNIPAENDSVESFYRPLSPGSFVDISDESSYRPDVPLMADYLPVVKDGKIVGMSDAYEIRFWLWQRRGKWSGRKSGK